MRPTLLTDHRIINELLANHIVDVLTSKLFPAENDNYRIEVHNLKISVPETVDPEEVKEAALAKKSITIPIKGKLVLIDKRTGKVVDQTGTRKLLEVPIFTPHLSFMVDGTEYTIFNQIRQRPGVYTRKRDTGEIETKFNTATGDNFSIVIDPQSKLITVQLKKGGSIPVVSVLRGLGYSDEEISKLLGVKLVKANFEKADKFEKNSKNRLKLKAFLDSLPEKTLDPETTRITLGKGFNKVDKETLYHAVKKALKVAKGEEEEDHLANLAFKQVLPAEKLLAEALEKRGRLIVNKFLARANQTKKLPSSTNLSPAIKEFITTSSLSTNPEQTNPIETLETALKVTYMGEGGIRSSHAIIDEYRDVHPSYTGFIDLIRTSESEKVGVDLRLNYGTYVDPETGKIYQKFVNARTGKEEYLSPINLYDKKVAFRPNSKVAVYKGKIVQTDKPDYYLPHPARMFNITTNMIPYLKTNHGNRAQMAAKMWTQAVPLVHREAPKIDLQLDNGMSLPEVLAKSILTLSPVDGTVKKVTDREIVIEDKNGKLYKLKLYNNYPLSRKTFLHETPIVKPGQKVKAGQVLTENNFTKDGKIALGTYLKIGYMPYKGLNHEDGIVVSESAAKKLTSMHMYKEDHELQKDKHIADIEVFKAQFPGELTKEQLGKLDKFGVVKPGTVLKKGDPIYAFVKKAEPTPEDVVLGRLSKDLLRRYQPDVEKWNKDVEGVVQDVHFDGKKLRVTIKTLEPAKPGDKLTLTHGAKGVITKVLPDDKMPRNEKGEPLDMIVTPVSILARINPGQLYELATAKVAEKTGESVKIPVYGPDGNVHKFVTKLLKEHGMADITEKVYDPEDGRWKEIATGPIYVLKLNKLTDYNYSARGAEGEYDVDLRPVKGGDEGSKAIGSMEFYALVSHNVPHLLQEMATFKASKMDDFWNAIMLGKPLPKPKPTFATQKFFAMLRGAGINVQKDNGFIKFLPMTDKDVLAYSSGEIKNPSKIDYKLNPEPGGLFDPTITGGLAGTKWAHIKLEHPIINPIFEDIVAKVIPNWQELTPSELEHKLSALRVDQLYKDEKDPKLKRVWRTLKDQGYKTLADAYLIRYIPVIPPKFRPIIPKGEKDLLVHDANYLYTDVILANQAIQKLKEEGLTEDMYQEDYRNLYKNVKALFGLAQPQSPFAAKRNIKGLLAIALGEDKAPKNSYFQSRIIKKLQAPAARGTLVTDDSLHIDEAAIPEDMAWKLYSPHIVRELVNRGHTPVEAKEMVDNQDPRARDILLQKMKEVPIIVNRAPSLWKYNLIALYPKLHDKKAVAINMLVAKGLAGDLDGDTVNVHIPVSPQAVEDAKKMLPSVIAVDPRTRLGLLYKPSQEADMGIKLGLLPRPGEKPLKVKSREEVKAKLRAGKADWRTPVIVEEDQK